MKRISALLAILVLSMFIFTGISRAESVTLAWDAPDGAVGYNLYYGTSSGTYPTKINAGNVLTYTVSVPVVGIPANVRLAISTATQPAGAIITWDSVANAVGYKIKYGTSPGNYSTVVDAGNNTQYLLAGLANDTTYYVVVSALGTPVTYYFTATAYDDTSMESGYAEEVSYNATESNNSAVFSFKTLSPPTLTLRQ